MTFEFIVENRLVLNLLVQSAGLQQFYLERLWSVVRTSENQML
jgi:hypothetical protein